MLLDVAYVGNKGTKLAAFRNLNQRAVSFSSVGQAVAGARPLAGVGLDGDIQFLENLGVSNYHSMQVRLEKRFSSGLSGLASYTWGKALTNSVDHLSTSGAGNGVDVGVFREPQNGFDRNTEYGLAEFDVKQRFVAVCGLAAALWRGPSFRVESRPGIQLGVWRLGVLTDPHHPGRNRSDHHPVSGFQYWRRAKEPAQPHRERSIARRPANGRRLLRRCGLSSFCTTIRHVPDFIPNQAFGNSGVGILRGPNLINLDFNLNKTFAIN